MSTSQAGTVRIIGGNWRGRRLKVGDAPGLRPSTDRNRETLFNWLMHEIEGAVCLDLFSGTGILAFEALSRGAEAATLVEQDTQLMALLEANQKLLQAESASLVNGDARAWLGRCEERFDLIFIDPPFHQNLVASVCDTILERSLLKPHGYLYLETEAGLVLPEFLTQHKQKTSGQVQYGLYQINHS